MYTVFILVKTIEEVEKLHRNINLERTQKMTIIINPCNHRFVLQFWIPGLGDTLLKLLFQNKCLIHGTIRCHVCPQRDTSMAEY